MQESTWPNCARYFKEDHDKLITKFTGSETIENNYSQAMQDMFVLTMLDGKKNGVYVEVGGDQPKVINNSYLLETEFGWSGVVIRYLILMKIEETNVYVQMLLIMIISFSLKKEIIQNKLITFSQILIQQKELLKQ